MKWLKCLHRYWGLIYCRGAAGCVAVENLKGNIKGRKQQISPSTNHRRSNAVSVSASSKPKTAHVKVGISSKIQDGEEVKRCGFPNYPSEYCFAKKICWKCFWIR